MAWVEIRFNFYTFHGVVVLEKENQNKNKLTILGNGSDDRWFPVMILLLIKLPDIFGFVYNFFYFHNVAKYEMLWFNLY